MKDGDFLPKKERVELTPLGKYAEVYRGLCEKIAEEHPELEYILYDDGFLLASPVGFPIIDENGKVGKSYHTNELKQDLTQDIITKFVKENRIEEKELYKFL